MIPRVLSCAEAELVEAVDYYNGQSPGLGYEFAAEVKASFDRITDFPDAWPKFGPRTRRCIVNRFPYGVLYHILQGSILVVAIMHLNRDPRRWEDMKERTSGQ